ncbi:hypothetical protein FGB62_65g15 [Gracilaria domingensis]|nr:hypothetical protein FGB62_65g15 [Gracilaria domingensis]
MQLLSLYVRRVQLCQKLLTAESRLHNSQQHWVQYVDKPSQNATLDEDHLVPAGNAANAPYSHADTHGVVPSMAGHQLEQQFLIQLEADALLVRLSDDGSSPSPSTTVTGNSLTSSIHDVGARANNIETDVSSALLEALTPPITASDIVASTENEGAQALQRNDETTATTATMTSAAVGAGVKAAGVAGEGGDGNASRTMTTDKEVRWYITCDTHNVPACRKFGHRFQKRGNLIRHIQAVLLS